MGKYMITRKQYKEIKKYDHGQMEDYLKDVYTLGYANGKEDAITALAEDKIEDYQKNDQHCQNDQQYGSQIVHKYTSSAAYCLAALHRHSLEG